jgi:hypothetical protein
MKCRSFPQSPEASQFLSRNSVNALQVVLILVPKGRRIVAPGGAKRNPGKQKKRSQPLRLCNLARTTICLGSDGLHNRRGGGNPAGSGNSGRLSVALFRATLVDFLHPRVPLRSTLGYGLVALSGLKAALSRASRVSRQKLARVESGWNSNVGAAVLAAIVTLPPIDNRR